MYPYILHRPSLSIAFGDAVGVAEPLAVYVDTQGTGAIEEAEIEHRLRRAVSLTPRAIRDRFQLDRPIYARTAAYGRFGRAP